MLHFQLKPLWKSSSFLGRSIIMNKKSQFTKIFFKAILDLKDSGTWDIMNGGKSRQMDQSYNLKDLILGLLGYKNGMEKALGYKKLAILFAVLGLGTFISLFVAFLEFITKMYFKKQNSTVTIHEQNLPREEFKWNINLLDSSFRRRMSI